MKELKKQILELLYQKLSVYGFKKKQQRLLIRTVKENNVVQINSAWDLIIEKGTEYLFQFQLVSFIRI